MDSNDVSKHTFQWSLPRLGQYGVDSKTFPLRVFDLDVTCFVVQVQHPSSSYNYMYQTFAYELAWTDCETKPFLYKCEVTLRDNGSVLWTDKKVTPDGRHVSSSDVFPKGSTTMNMSGAATVELDFEFIQQAGVKKNNFMSVAELALPLFEENILSDVVVVCGEKTFNCHKFMLVGRSKVFKSMLTSSFKEANENQIHLEDCEPEVAKLFIDFIYSDDVAEDAVTWELFDLAKMYELPALQTLCLQSLRKNLDVDNCAKMLEAACKHDLDDVFNYAMNFFKANKSNVSKTEGWKGVAANIAVLNKIALHP